MASYPHESVLGEQLGCSRTVIREMSRLLTAKGMVNPVRHFGTAVRHHQHWNLLDPDVALWHELDSPTIEFMREELRALMGSGIAAGREQCGAGSGQDRPAEEGSSSPVSPEAIMVMIFDTAGSRVYQNARDLGLHFARLQEPDAFKDSLYEKLKEAVTQGRSEEAKSCAEFLLNH